jgi:hypothetical protein
MLSAPLVEHDSESTRCMECCAKRLTFSSMEPQRIDTTRHAAGARESQEVREGCDGWRRPHPEQPLGGTDGCRTRQHGGSGLKSTTGAGRGGSSPWITQGGCDIKNQ